MCCRANTSSIKRLFLFWKGREAVFTELHEHLCIGQKVHTHQKKVRALLTVEALHTDGSGVCIHCYCHFRARALGNLYPWKATFRSITVRVTLRRAVSSFPRRMRHQEQPLRTNRLHSLLANMQTSSLRQTAESNTFHNLVLQHKKRSMDISHLEEPRWCLCRERSVCFDTEAKYFFPFSLS